MDTIGPVDAVVCDPPYGVDIAGWDHGTPPASHWLRLRRATKPGGYLMAFAAARTQHVIASAIEAAGWEITADTMVWLYGTGFAKGRGALRPGFEPIIVARNGPGRLEIQQAKVLAGKWPTNVVLDDDEARWAPFFYCAKPSLKEKEAGLEGMTPEMVETMVSRLKGTGPRPRRNVHPTVKPIAVMEWLIELCTRPGDLVLDPFCGSGTTGCAAVLAGRNFLGIEKDEKYVDIARVRIAYWAGRR